MKITSVLAKRNLPILGMLVVGIMVVSARQSPDPLAPYTLTLPNSVVTIPMVPVPGGTVALGGKTVEVKPFYMAVTPTTWEAFDAFINSGPPSKPYDQTVFAPDAIARPSKSYILPDLGWGHHGYPAMDLSFTSAQMFCRWLASTTKKKYRLPTEAEWEIACRAGMPGDWKLSGAEANKSAWYFANSKGVTHPVGTKQANKLGLFDMLGDVGQWATDLDGRMILCGASYADAADLLSPASRKHFTPAWQEEDPQIPKSRWWLSDAPFAGFRVVCEP
jgi:formylglycine-generating enzyme required for sulfatase activity